MVANLPVESNPGGSDRAGRGSNYKHVGRVQNAEDNVLVQRAPQNVHDRDSGDPSRVLRYCALVDVLLEHQPRVLRLLHDHVHLAHARVLPVRDAHP